MPGPGRRNDEERLPWLEPYRDVAAARPAPAPHKKSRAGIFAGGVAALVAALTAGYYIGQRDPLAPSPPPSVALAPVTPAPVLPVTPAIPQPAAEIAPPVKAEPVPAPDKVAAVTPRKAVERPIRQRKIRNARVETAKAKQVRAAQKRAPRPAARAWPRMPSPGPAGQVVQLGAFRNPAGANRAYQKRLARYPVLGSMPRVVVPVITKPRGQILYVLRLGTSSRQQSKVVCRNLRASGDHCLVIG